MAGHIMNAEKKTIEPLPTEQPIAEVAWLDIDLLALPLGPEEGSEVNRLVLYDRAKRELFPMPLPLGDPDQLTDTGNREQALVLGTGESGRTIYRADFSTSQITRAFAWLEGDIDTFTYEPTLDRLLIGRERTVTMYEAATGTVLGTFVDATRGSLHPEGRYLALETLGAAISPFDQRTWDETSPEQRERELRRQEEWLAHQPDWVPKEVQPPTIDVVDLERSERFRITGFHGDRFEWYPTYNYFSSFVLWGIEGKELNKNVALTNLAERLRMAGGGNIPLGLERWTPPAQPNER
jgi:hypothetical protein